MKLSKLKIDIEFAETHQIEGMCVDEYTEYLDKLIILDVNNLPRSNVAGYPIARTEEQFDMYINHLINLKNSVIWK